MQMTEQDPRRQRSRARLLDAATTLLAKGGTDAVTIDVWAARVGVYDAIADAYRAAAQRAGVTPSVMQATTWTVARPLRSADALPPPA